MQVSQTTIKTETLLSDKFSFIFESVIQKEPAFLEILKRADLREECRKVYHGFKNSSQVIVLGIGGSSLGGRTLAQIFRQTAKVRFFENVDGYDFFKNLDQLENLKSTHFVVISKSGSTVETLTQLNFLNQYMIGRQVEWMSACTVLTEKKHSPLYDWAQKNKIPTLEIPVPLGGRFSVLSPVGLYPALFMGLDIEGLAAGGKSVYALKKECAEFCAQVIQSFDRKEMITVFWSYSESLKNLGLWIQQLWAESLGKKLNLAQGQAPQASTPLPLIGTNDQHSVLQQIMEGQRDKFIVFLTNRRDEQAGPQLQHSLFDSVSYLQGKKMGDVLRAHYIGTQNALKNAHIQSLTLPLLDLKEENVGQLFVFFQMCVAMIGEYHNINTYDQPGVEQSKKLAADLLRSESSR